MLEWTALPGGDFAIETSANLMDWTPISVIIRESSSGHYKAQLPANQIGTHFFRIRM